jgi:hypothetical protein
MHPSLHRNHDLGMEGVGVLLAGEGANVAPFGSPVFANPSLTLFT